MTHKWIKLSALLLFSLFLLLLIPARPGASKTGIVSWYTADIDGDGKEELLVITRRDPDVVMTLESGEEYGDFLKIFSDYEIVENRPIWTSEPDYQFDFTAIKPHKIQAGDVDGDGIQEIAICVYKTTEFHPVLARRPFFYRLVDGELESMWLGSRLARPFTDYTLFDVDGDGIDEIISIEYLENKNQVIAVYDWKGFGFEVRSLSDELEGTVAFTGAKGHRPEELWVMAGQITSRLVLDGDRVELISN